jgi:hypothetical protein
VQAPALHRLKIKNWWVTLYYKNELQEKIPLRKKNFDLLWNTLTQTLRSLHWLPIYQRIEFKIAVLVFCCLIGLAPLYLTALISIRDSGRETSSSSQLLLHSPRTHTKGYGDRAFSAAAPRIWNSLPLELRLLVLFPILLVSLSHNSDVI